MLHVSPSLRELSLSPRAGHLVGLTRRDRQILLRTMGLLVGATGSFAEALRAMQAAVEELIPAGRIYFLGAGDRGPIVGSLISGVGIAEGEGGIQVVRVGRNGLRVSIGGLSA